MDLKFPKIIFSNSMSMWYIPKNDSSIYHLQISRSKTVYLKKNIAQSTECSEPIYIEKY